MYFDVAMPFTLFAVAVIALFLNRRVESKLKGVFEEKEFRVRDAVLLVAAVSVTVSIVVFIPQLAIMVLFLFSYSMLLFIFSYLFSSSRHAAANVLLLAFMVFSLLAASFSLLAFPGASIAVYGFLAFGVLSAIAAASFVHGAIGNSKGERWYVAVLPPALFILLYLFFSRTSIWFPYILDTYGIVFAVLIILYMASVFTWKTTVVFAGLLTAMDIILVLFTGTMVSAARSISTLRLPVLVSLPTVPEITFMGSILYMSLGLGDFFFAGLLTLQTQKRYGWKTAVSGIAVMSISFFIFEVYLLNFAVTAFPGTLMIICGWLVVVAAAELFKRRTAHTAAPRPNVPLGTVG